MFRTSRTTLFIVVMLLVFAGIAETALACPTCKDGMAGDPAYSNMVNGYFWSIIFMMSMPFLVFSGVAAYFYYEVRRARIRQAAAAASTKESSDTPLPPEIALQN